jgi:hypothetical protein
MKVYFYTVQEYFGNPQETNEMGQPEFFDRQSLPYQEMMPADKVIFERLLQHDYRELDVILGGKDIPPIINETKTEINTERDTQGESAPFSPNRIR